MTQHPPLPLSSLAHLPDHRIGGRAVLPAVDIMAALARVVLASYPRCEVRSIGKVQLLRVLGVEELPRCALSVRCEGEGPVRATLLSQLRAPNGMGRTREHAVVEFGIERAGPAALPPAANGEFALEAARAYASLVPFGPWFHNLQGTLHLSPAGGHAQLRTPPGAPPDNLLGSPFLLDAAMHLACVWGQRYAGVTAIPVALASRSIIHPIAQGQAACRIAWRGWSSDNLTFDVWLLDEQQRLSEAATGLQLMPQRSMAAPDWVREGAPVLV